MMTIGTRTTHPLDKYAYSYLIIVICIAAYVGSRMPSFWSINYYLPSFFDGFYRRGLLGTLLYPLGDLRFSYTWISSIQISVLIGLLLSILKYAYRTQIQKKIMLILFFLAPSGGYFFHLIGYSDQILYLLLIIALTYIQYRWIALSLMASSLFIHEAALLTIIPIYFVFLLLIKARSQRIILDAFVIASLFLCFTLFLQTVPVPKIESFAMKTSQMIGPSARLEYFLTFHNQYTQQAMNNTFYNLQNQIAPPPHGNFIFLYFEITLLFIYSMCVAKLFVDPQSNQIHRGFSFVTAWLACLLPLTLVFCGIDADRWVFLGYASTVFMFCMNPQAPSNRNFLSMTFVFLIFLAYGHFWYFDGCSPRGLEFPQLKYFWQNWIHQ
jgi:hypothetical protein